MNELIKKIAREAYIQTAIKESPSFTPGELTDMLLDDLDTTFQKFAELIVKECAKVISADGEFQISEGVYCNLGGLNQAKALINKHFGVEE